MRKMPGTLCHVFAASLTLEVPVNGSHARVEQPAEPGLVAVHEFKRLDASDRDGFLKREMARAYDFLWRENAKLDRLDSLDGSSRVRKAVESRPWEFHLKLFVRWNKLCFLYLFQVFVFVQVF